MDGLQQPILSAGRSIANDALSAAVAATGGYPFMIQLLGYQMWNVTTSSEFQLEHVSTAISAAKSRLGALVYEAALRDLSPVDREFLYAMAEDMDGPSRMIDISERMRRTASYVSQYRLRLLGSDLVREAGYGRLEFAMPFLGQYLRDNRMRWLDNSGGN